MHAKVEYKPGVSRDYLEKRMSMGVESDRGKKLYDLYEEHKKELELYIKNEYLKNDPAIYGVHYTEEPIAHKRRA